MKSLCNSGINCDDVTSDGIRLADKIIFDRSELSEEHALLAGSSYILSANMDLIAFRTKYEKQWRHSYKASYAIFTTKFFESGDGNNEPKLVGTVDDVWLFAFEPSPKALDMNDEKRRKFLFVDETKNLHYGDVTSDGVLKVKPLSQDSNEAIYNGVPDWVYEEEMLASRSASWWSPNGDNIVYVRFDTTGEEDVEYNYYARSDDQAARADDYLISDNSDRYPQVERIPYSKPGGEIASYQVWFCSGLVSGEDSCQEIATVSSLKNKELFARVDFINDVHLDQSNTDIKTLFYITTQNRIGSASSYLECYYLNSKLECKAIEALDETTDKNGEFTGWIDSGAIMNDPYISQNWLFRIAYKFDACNSLQAYNKGEKTKFDLIDGEGVCIQSVHSIGRPVSEDQVTTDYSIRFYASVPEKSWERHVYQINYKP